MKKNSMMSTPSRFTPKPSESSPPNFRGFNDSDTSEDNFRSPLNISAKDSEVSDFRKGQTNTGRMIRSASENKSSGEQRPSNRSTRRNSEPIMKHEQGSLPGVEMEKQDTHTSPVSNYRYVITDKGPFRVMLVKRGGG